MALRTQVLTVAADCPEPGPIAAAASVLRAGGLVAFPTETVYGLGADALDPAAVRRVFEAKGRPARNPLIVHVPSASAARALALEWTTLCETLAARFWPGPLTLVVRRSRSIPADVTAGGPTVALRVPAHPVALALLNAAQVPIAAPSANRSGLVSPTEAAHVLAGLRGRIDIVLDAGRTQAGIESTVLDVTGSVPVVLRPGPISSDELEAALGCVIGDRAQPGQEEVLRSPGLLSRHYCPRTPVLCPGTDATDAVDARLRQGDQVLWLCLGSPRARRRLTSVVMPLEPSAYGSLLYRVLHAADVVGVDVVIADMPPDEVRWSAVRDRLSRASA